MNEKGEFGSEADFDTFLNQQHNARRAVSPGVASSSSSVTVFDPTSSANRERYFDSEDDLAKDTAPFLPRDVEKDGAKKATPEHVTWMSLPHKGQLLILFMCRFVDFLQVASLQAYVFYQLKHMAEQRTIETGGSGTLDKKSLYTVSWRITPRADSYTQKQSSPTPKYQHKPVS